MSCFGANHFWKMALACDRLLLAAILLLALSAVESLGSSFYPPSASYYKTPLYCDSNNRYATPRETTACYHRLTRNTCCMTSYTKSENHVIQQECLCGPSTNNEAQVVASTQTTTVKVTTVASTSTTTPTTASTSTTTTRAASTSTTTPRAASTSTTTAFQSLCSTSSFRVLGGDLVEDHCQFSGVANITQADDTIQTCNAVYTKATVNGVIKPTFLTSRACKEGIERVTRSNLKTEIQLGNQAYPLTSDLFTLEEGPYGTAFIDIKDRYVALLTDLDTCQKLACPYNKVKMASLLDFNDCKIVSWGASSAAPTFAHSGLREAAIKLSPNGCSTIKNLFGASDTMCFRTKSGAKLSSQGDTGAPIYCKATSNGEWILVGIAAEQLSWGSTADLKVIPYPD